MRAVAEPGTRCAISPASAACCAYRALTDEKRPGGPLALAVYWSHFRRRFYDIARDGNAPIADEALQRIGRLYEIHGQSAEQRKSARQERSKPLTDDLKLWLQAQLRCVSGRAPIAEAIRYGLSHWGP